MFLRKWDLVTSGCTVSDFWLVDESSSPSLLSNLTHFPLPTSPSPLSTASVCWLLCVTRMLHTVSCSPQIQRLHSNNHDTFQRHHSVVTNSCVSLAFSHVCHHACQDAQSRLSHCVVSSQQSVIRYRVDPGDIMSHLVSLYLFSIWTIHVYLRRM